MQFGLDLGEALHLWVWIGRLWPVVLIASIWLLCRNALRKPLTFALLGVLVCFGVQLVVSQLSVLLPVSTGGGSLVGAEFLTGLLGNVVRTTVASWVLSIFPLVALYRTMRASETGSCT
jgi:hypothetical protein